VIGNVSLWEVIPRSLATTFITLLPIASLYFLGGDTLKDFAFALLVGIGAGAYSSIFLAAPLLAWIKEREPEFARRKDDDLALAGVQTVGGALGEEEEETLPAASVTLVEEAEELLVPDTQTGIEPAPAPAGAGAAASAKRERRRQRRSGRPHGRAR
jgi:hypothetical protein